MLARLDGISVDELLSERGPYRGRLRLRGGNAAKNPSRKKSMARHSKRNTHLSKGSVVKHAGRKMKVVRPHSKGYILQPMSGDRRFVSATYPQAGSLQVLSNGAAATRTRQKSKPSTSKARPSRARSAKGYTVKQLKGSVQVGPGKYAKNPWVIHYDGLPIERASGMAYGLTKAKAQQIASKLRGQGAGEAEYERMHSWLGAHHNPRKRDRKGRFTKTSKRGSSKSKGRRSSSKSNRRRDSRGRFTASKNAAKPLINAAREAAEKAGKRYWVKGRGNAVRVGYGGHAHRYLDLYKDGTVVLGHNFTEDGEEQRTNLKRKAAPTPSAIYNLIEQYL